jgi:hypothetical protein
MAALGRRRVIFFTDRFFVICPKPSLTLELRRPGLNKLFNLEPQPLGDMRPLFIKKLGRIDEVSRRIF